MRFIGESRQVFTTKDTKEGWGLKKALAAIGLGIFTLMILLPIVWVLISSLKSGSEIVGNPWSLPSSPQWVNYSNAWKEAGIGQAFLNSLIVTASTLLILLPSGAMAAYVLARYVFPGRNLIFGSFLGGMMFPNFLVIVPL